jgi:multiple sugar transport system ATP-binding protein
MGSPAMNLVDATPVDGHARVGDHLIPIDRAAASRAGGDVTVGVRPEHWRLVGADEGGLPIQVTLVEELGADAFLYGTCDLPGTPADVVVRVDARCATARGETVHVTTDPGRVHVFDSGSGERLSD